jgi:hypothetical protein
MLDQIAQVKLVLGACASHASGRSAYLSAQHMTQGGAVLHIRSVSAPMTVRKNRMHASTIVVLRPPTCCSTRWMIEFDRTQYRMRYLAGS